MAGMFYSIQQTAQKLGRTDDQIKELVKEGRLREFRDGPNLLFKIDEVEALLADTTFVGEQAVRPSAEAPGEPEEVSAVSAEPSAKPEEEIFLAPEEPADTEAVESGIAEADTALADEGVSVLGEEEESDYKLSDDSMAETRSGTAAEMLEQIEEDVNLDTFGSGSGLLDLSLQADDTSLGGILDEIYTAEGEQPVQPQQGQAVTSDVAAEAEQMMAEEQVSAATAPAEVVVSMYAEPEADTSSNIFGIMLFLPLLVVFYTLVVSLVAQRGAIPSLLGGIQGFIWPTMGVVLLLAAGLSVAGMVTGGGKTAKKPKVKKEKKPKEEKPKEQKPKKEKKKKEKKNKGKEPEGQQP